jgi:integrase
MASQQFDPKSGKARLFFRYGGRQCNRTVKVKSERAAEALCETIEQTIADLDRGRLSLPPDADLVTFLISGGTVDESKVRTAAPKAVTLADLFERYRTDPPPHLEQSTRGMQEIHFKRLGEVFPGKTLKSFDKSAAQEYVSRRSKQKFRNKPIQRETIAKELKSFRQAWSWVATRSADLPPPTFALKDLSFPKSKERLPFMSWPQIEREIARGGLSEDEVRELWDCLWLDRQEVRELLEHVRQTGGPPFLYPMVCFAAFTGARRSESLSHKWDYADSR